MGSPLGLSSKRWKQFFVVCGIIALPFLFFSFVGGIKNEGGMVLFPTILTGFPWIFLYLLLPFDIPGFTSAGVPNAQGDLQVSTLHILLFLIPTFINIFLLFYILFHKEGNPDPVSAKPNST
ncbi:hypothetical protein A2671_01710 [Candidatus Kaiserbacteria bacterium RIFCSPHIGHO2_01_FULL_49_13]|uniref:Uncharacterized protein n=1 Tax=Candidatus Kaiserbacteria bacterium RIFCSPHIGHO2_01_FULL_49_13 TaxID=1798477 RepID=A0A1F6CEL8_9BACT|nr:MAG: hypothetical protein A2671_01710 [Candidatus Kaiserbacteria bacterium RIFCSPHIGHO2_01_FULL_49_13]